VLVLRPGALGDTLLAVPALRTLRTLWPGAELTLAAHAAAARLLVRYGEVDVGLSFEDSRLAWLWAPTSVPGVPAISVSPAPSLPDGALLPDAVIGWLSDAERRLQRRLAALAVDRVLLVPSRPANTACHMAHYLWQSLAPLAAPLPPFGDGPFRLAGVGDCNAPRGKAEVGKAVLLHPGSGSARKNWSARSFAAVAEMLLRRGIAVRVVVGEADVESASRLDQALGHPLPRLTMLTLAELAAELASSRAYLGNDSGVSHLAGLVGVPTFALFGPTDPHQWRPLGPRVTVLRFDTTPAAVAAALWEA
jgi:ADP-heptose:LPS heptosyltransferase